MITQYITAIATFAAVSVALWWLMDVRLWYMRPFDYKPFNCRKCLTFWSLAAISVGALMLGFTTYGVTLLVIASLNGIAMAVEERRRYG